MAANACHRLRHHSYDHDDPGVDLSDEGSALEVEFLDRSRQGRNQLANMPKQQSATNPGAFRHS
jgi:hypothetical protein